MGLPGEELGPLVSQFFVRDINFGTQTIVQKQRPYKKDKNYLTKYDRLAARAKLPATAMTVKLYPRANEKHRRLLRRQANIRYISTMRDLARFVNKDALHQAYFNAALHSSVRRREMDTGQPLWR